MTPRHLLAGAAVLALGSGLALAQAVFDFMPDGGRNLLVQVVGESPDELAELAAQSRDAEGWRDWLGQRQPELTEAEAATLASYLALNLPLPEPEALAALEPGELAAALPRDGKDLAIRHCQGCHGFYTGYLGHDRDANGWMVMFNSPFHMEIRMNRTERLAFAWYSEFNLPMPRALVPPDLRH